MEGSSSYLERNGLWLSVISVNRGESVLYLLTRSSTARPHFHCKEQKRFRKVLTLL